MRQGPMSYGDGLFLILGTMAQHPISHLLLTERCGVIHDSLETIAFNGIQRISCDNWTTSTDFDIFLVGHYQGQDQKKGQDQGQRQIQALAGSTKSHTRSTNTEVMAPETKFVTGEKRKGMLNYQKKRKGEF